jgi:cytochrome b subunit of formate dehydrogenase
MSGDSRKVHREDKMEQYYEEVHERESWRRSSWFAGLTSFFFIMLQSACTAVLAISGLRLVIGLTSLAAASIIPRFIFSIHAARFRVPMMIVAVLGSLINLYVLWRLRSLRSRPAAQWRVKPVSYKQRRSEIFQVALAVVTLVLIVVESLIHHRWHGSF